jgi:peptide/nickel transport system substrate-binding protein
LLALALACMACTGGTRRAVVVAYSSGLPTLLPHESNDESTQSILSNVFEPLVELDGELALRPRLAKSWHTPDPRTWIFRLREDVRLHDGRLLEAADVARALLRTRDDPRSRRRADLAMIASIDTPDKYQVVVHTHYAFGPLPNRLASAPVWVDGLRPGDPPLGTGPYRLGQWTPGQVTLQAFDKHVEGPPSVRELIFKAVSSTDEQKRQLEAGEVDLVPGLDLGVTSKPTDPLRTVTRNGLTVVLMVVDCGRISSPYVDLPSNPFRDARVRRALALAVDRDRLVREALAGRGQVVHQIVGPQVFGYHPAQPARAFDQEQARRLLVEAGHGGGFGFHFDFLNHDDMVAVEGVVRSLAADLGKIGLRVTPRANDATALLRRIETRDTSAYLLPWIGTSGDAGITAEYLLHTPRDGYGIDNGGGYSDPQVDHLLEEAGRQLLPTQRRPLLEALATRVFEEVPVVPLYQPLDVYAVRSTLEFQPRLDRAVRGAALRWR